MSDYKMQSRKDLMEVFNRAHFVLRHYARGYYPTAGQDLKPLPVNRMFFPLRNPNGRENFIEDSFRRYPLVPGNLYFVPGFLPACFHLDDQLYFLSIQTSLEIFPGVEFFSGCPRMLEIPFVKERDELLRFFDSDAEMQYSTALKAGGLIFSMLTTMLDYYKQEDFWKPLALRRYVHLTDYLQKQGNALTSVQELAELEHESRESFTRKFTVCTGITPKQMIDRFVMSRCLSLVNQGLCFKEISAILRFRDEFSFSRYFKRNMGVSPSAWRNRQSLFKGPAISAK